MDEDWQPTAIPGVMRRTLTRHEDTRGAVREAWRASWTQPFGLSTAQVNHAVTRAGALRGLHFHVHQSDLWVVLDGRAHVGLADIRAQLSGQESRSVSRLSIELGPGDAVLIPVGVAHGMWALTDVSLLYVVTAEYDGSDEHGFAWDDPTADVRWPDGAPVLSQRDNDAPTLAQAVDRVRAAPSG